MSIKGSLKMKMNSGSRWLAVGVGLLVVCGCGGAAGQSGRLSGTVTFEGEPVTEGIITFYSQEADSVGQADLQADGTYELPIGETGLKPGTYQVSILPLTILTPDTPDSPGGEELMEVDNIPEKYRSASTSGLSAVVPAGDETYNVEMKEGAQ